MPQPPAGPLVPALHSVAHEILAADPSAWAASARKIGQSRQNRPILGFEAGHGNRLVTLIGGCHADEPVGPAFLDRFASYLVSLPRQHSLLCDARWKLVPHVNPDGEERNLSWTRRLIEVRDHRGEPDVGYDLGTYLRSVVRELPGDDIEFGFPSHLRDQGSTASPLRPENHAVAEFLAPSESKSANPICLHGSFHGMGLAPGPWFLTEGSWRERTAGLRQRLTATVETMGYRLFDVERHGEKGFHRIAPGFSTRPDSVAMRAFFKARGETEEAAKFRPSSMEFARAHGSDPLTLVPEMPLFLTPTVPGRVERRDLEAVREKLLKAVARGRSELTTVAEELGVAPMPIRDQMRLQLRFLSEALGTCCSANP